MEEKTKELCEKMTPQGVNYIGSMFSVSFEDIDLFKKFYHGLLKRGVYFSPSMYEANFLSAAHTVEDIDKTLKAVESTLEAVS